MTDETGHSGWEMVAGEDEAAAVIAGLMDIDPDTEYTRSELADAVGLPLKTLYLIEILDDLEAAGMLERVDDVDAESEATFRLDNDSDVYEAARQFDRALAENL
jgi:DNA-binding IclR family transcriptional regulator